MWNPTQEEIAYYKRIGQCVQLDDQYVIDTLPLILEMAQSECTTEFNYPDLPSNVKLFLAHSLQFYGAAQPGIDSEKMGTVSYSYDFTKLPSYITDFLANFGYGRKRNRARFHVL